MENDNKFDPSNQENGNQETEEVLESEISEDDYQFTEKGFDPEKE